MAPADVVYADHAATTWPRPAKVAQAMAAALADGANPGRSGHRLSLQGARCLFAARTAVARLLGVADARRVVLTPGCTQALNIVLRGLPLAGRRVVTTGMEHNAVARPLTRLEVAGVHVIRVAPDAQGRVDPAALANACDHETALVVVQHASNVTGTIQDLPAIRRAIPGVPLLVDAAQTAGAVDLEVDGWGIDYVAFSGHKGLCGPPGIGGLCLGPGAVLPEPLLTGGTGSVSEETTSPEFLPDRLEAGTPNWPGAAGLAAAVAWLEAEGLAAVRAREHSLCAEFLAGLESVPEVHLTGPPEAAGRLPVFALRFDGVDPGAVALRLEREHGVLVRAGLHCAPWAHEALGTFPAGTVRVSFGPTSAPDAARRVLAALFAVAGGA